MSNTSVIFAIIIMSAVTILLRFAPFVIFSGRKTPDIIVYLGKVLPCAVIGMLVVYCLKDISFGSASGFLPALISAFIVVLTFLWKKNSLLSIVSGTVCYMLLVQFVFV